MKKLLNKYLPLAYGMYFNTISFFSEVNASKKAFRLFCTPRKGKVLPFQETYLNNAKTNIIIGIEPVKIEHFFVSQKKLETLRARLDKLDEQLPQLQAVHPKDKDNAVKIFGACDLQYFLFKIHLFFGFSDQSIKRNRFARQNCNAVRTKSRRCFILGDLTAFFAKRSL